MNESIPQVGMLATVRNRRAVISSVEPYDQTADGKVLHLVSLEYTDSDGERDETLLWETEYQPTVLEPNAMPAVETESPMRLDEFNALQRATRWGAATPFLQARDVNARADLPLSAPVYGALQVDDFQLVPLARAIQMPRVSLLLADDVGLGKTIEAGLILSELIRKRRIRRILVVTPAALRYQWQQELEEKFSLGFDIVDKKATHNLQKNFGLDTNAWRTLPRVITSYHYLRQPDVLEQFLATCRTQNNGEGKQGAHLPWDLLIVDEAHNLMPSNFGEDSDLAEMLRHLSPWFEHKLFLTATPHNGYTRCFSGLLEQLDPVRFTKTPNFTDKEKGLVQDVLIRRLKRDINIQDKDVGRIPRFAERYPEPLPLFFSKSEKALSMAVATFCNTLRGLIKTHPDARAVLNFAIEVFKKRLLSSPVTFADSWLRFKQGLAEDEGAADSEVVSASRALADDIDDDLELEIRGQHASQVVGLWMHPYVDELHAEIDAIDQALQDLALTELPTATAVPSCDTRLEHLEKLINQRLRNANQWCDDERLIIFTEYKTTLDYLTNRLTKLYDDVDAVVNLYGGMDDDEREQIKLAFNDPTSTARILVATDAASEGLNLQETARLLLHYEIPWNPSRLEQRNGRLDRHGQSRDVTIYHFTSEDDADLKFVARVLLKVNEIREDLGSVGELFDAAFQRRMQEQQDDEFVFDSLDNRIRSRKQASEIATRKEQDTGGAYEAQIKQLCEDLDLTPVSLAQTLNVALGLGSSRDALDGPDQYGRMRLKTPVSPRWAGVVSESLRLPSKKKREGALPYIVFDSDYFVEERNGRPVFRHSTDTVLLHLGHPLFRQALASFARLRFPGGVETRQASRWLVTRGFVPEGADAVILLSVEEMAVNEVRETFHHWMRVLALPIVNDELQSPLDYWISQREGLVDVKDAQTIAAGRELWADFEGECKQLIKKHRQALTDSVSEHLSDVQIEVRRQEKAAFDERIGEIKRLKKDQNIQKLQEEIEELKEKYLQLDLYEDADERAAQMLRDAQDELKRRTRHFDDLLERLKLEKTRVLDRVVPLRYALRGQAQVFPVTVEIRFPEVAQ